MKDWYWIPIFVIIIGTVFLPAILKAKCPKCKQRRIVQIENDGNENEDSKNENSENEKHTYYFVCQACQAKFKKVKSGPLQEA